MTRKQSTSAITRDDINEILDVHEMTLMELASRIGTNRETVLRWLGSQHHPSEHYQEKLRELLNEIEYDIECRNCGARTGFSLTKNEAESSGEMTCANCGTSGEPNPVRV